GVLLDPIALDPGSTPRGFDFTADGARMYVAASGTNAVLAVELATRAVVDTLSIPPWGFDDSAPLSLAIAADGEALVSTTADAPLARVELASGIVSRFGAGVPELTYLQASGDRSLVGLVLGGVSPGSVEIYDASTSTLAPPIMLDSSLRTIAVDLHGTRIVV